MGSWLRGLVRVALPLVACAAAFVTGMVAQQRLTQQAAPQGLVLTVTETIQERDGVRVVGTVTNDDDIPVAITASALLVFVDEVGDEYRMSQSETHLLYPGEFSRFDVSVPVPRNRRAWLVEQPGTTVLEGAVQ